MMELALKGKRIMILEDDFIIALLVEEALLDHGCEIVWPVNNVRQALILAETEALEAAVLDVNVAGVSAFPVASMLESRGIPFLFVSGYGPSVVSNRNWKVCPKPFRPEGLARMLAEQIEAA